MELTVTYLEFVHGTCLEKECPVCQWWTPKGGSTPKTMAWNKKGSQLGFKKKGSRFSPPARSRQALGGSSTTKGTSYTKKSDRRETTAKKIARSENNGQRRPERTKRRCLKMKIREMIRLSIEDSERWRRGLGKEMAARPATPERANRPGDNAESPAVEKFYQDNGICRVVGFIPFSRGSNSGLPPGWDL